MKNVLLVGDFTDCNNYGAIATTEMLLKMIETKVGKDHIKSISHRSFNRATPLDGWKTSGFEYRKQQSETVLNLHGKDKILDFFDNSIILKIYRTIKADIQKKKGVNPGFDISNFHVPYRFEDFDSFFSNVKNGKSLQYEKHLIEWSDIVLVNAEGSLVKGTDINGYYHVTGLYPLYIAYISKKYFRKKVYIINHTVDPQNRDVMHMIRNVYPLLDGVYIREPLSGEILEKCNVRNYEFVPDALFSYSPPENWKPNNSVLSLVDYTKPYICLGDSSGFYTDRDRIWDIEYYYNELIHKLKKICPQIVFIVGFGKNFTPIMNVIRKNDLPYVSINNTTYHDLFYILHHSKIFVSGRWHTSILSLLADTPILLFGSDSHKTEALYEMLDYPYRFFDDSTIPVNIDSIISETKLIMRSDNSKYFQKAKEYGIAAQQNVKMLNEL